MANFDWLSVQVPLPVLLATATTIGYMVGRWRRCGEICPHCKQELHSTAALESEPAADGLQKA